MRADNSKRTRSIRRFNIIFICSLIVTVIGGIWLGIGNVQFADVVARSSSPVGTKMAFGRSNAQVKIAGIYTDEASSVLIVRIASESSSDTLKLPYKGSDFNVTLASNGLNAYAGERVPVLFGRYSTDGDLFLVIPKPTKDVYNVFITNKNFVATNDLVSNSLKDTSDMSNDAVSNTNSNSNSSSSSNSSSTTSSSSTTGYNVVSTTTAEQEDAALASALNQYLYTDVNNRSAAIKVDSDVVDTVGFRVTINPALTQDVYKPQVIGAKLLSDDGNFDFQTFFDKVFKETVTSQLENDYNNKTSQRDMLQQRITELKQRLIENPNDSGAKQLLSEVQKQLDDVNEQLSTLSSAYDSYDKVSYKPSMFKNMQTEAKVLSTKDVGAVGEATSNKDKK